MPPLGRFPATNRAAERRTDQQEDAAADDDIHAQINRGEEGGLKCRFLRAL